MSGNLLKELGKSGFGCWVNGNYNGILGYSDDNMLIAPSQYALQAMLNICEKSAADHNLKFSTDANPVKCKTKCIAFQRKSKPLVPMILCGNPLPWVEPISGTTHVKIVLQKRANQEVQKDAA